MGAYSIPAEAMTCTHYDITGKFNYFRCIKRKKEKGSHYEFEEEIYCTQCFAKFIPKPEEKGECSTWCRGGCPANPCPCSCHKKVNQGGIPVFHPCPCGSQEPIGECSKCRAQKPSEEERAWRKAICDVVEYGFSSVQMDDIRNKFL
jgi:hypothetical protein